VRLVIAPATSSGARLKLSHAPLRDHGGSIAQNAGFETACRSRSEMATIRPGDQPLYNNGILLPQCATTPGGGRRFEAAGGGGAAT